jgi:two-component sensor histidine kinase
LHFTGRAERPTDVDHGSIEGPDVRLPHEAVQILALAVHELATNARKHGALGTPDGGLAVSWQVTPLTELGVSRSCSMRAALRRAAKTPGQFAKVSVGY